MNDLNLTLIEAQHCTSTIANHVVTITMNRPEKLNGWTMDMMMSFKSAIAAATKDDRVKVIIFTGSGKYFSAGVNLSSTIKMMHPKKLKNMIVELNQSLFEIFLLCPKPILVAINGPAIGASVTSATLCNGIIASENATFSLPFAALGVTPEGCSSLHFPRLIGPENAQRMLGEEGWKPTGKEALEAGLVQWCVPHDDLRKEASKIAKEWVENNETRKFLAGSTLDELREVNKSESVDLANAFLAKKFLLGQARFLWSKGKFAPALTFYSLVLSRPLWSRFL
jgi:enoyl-CoA hydratase/carnithine racemase